MAAGGAVIFLVATGLIMLAIYDYFAEAQREDLRIQTAAVAKGIELENEKYLYRLDLGGYRVTWIGEDGHIIYDSHPGQKEMDNHLNRQEIQMALNTGYGESQRYSDTMLEKMLYSAQRLENGSVLRVSMPQRTILLFLIDMSFPIAVIILLLCIVSVLFAYSETNKANQEASEKMRREFTANVSHELKTPLHSISGYAELLKSELVRYEDIGEFADRIYSETQRMIRLVQDIIVLSRLDEGKEGAKKVDVNLYKMAQAVCYELATVAEEKNVDLELIGQEINVKGVPQLLHSMLYNICENSIKYNHNGGNVVVSIEEASGRPQISVRDSGIGIAKSDQKRIFERFYRVDKSHSKELGGTGLGLSIVKHAAKLHNAKIEVESIVGEGTIMIVRF